MKQLVGIVGVVVAESRNATSLKRLTCNVLVVTNYF